MSSKKVTKITLLDRLVRDGLSESREVASKEILAGLIRVNGEVVDKVGAIVSDQSEVRVASRKEFVSRAAYKLEAAVKLFKIPVAKAVCADVGACTGGFTEILLRHGAQRVYAIDVGYGDLDWKIRSDSRVVLLERTNARYLESLGEEVSVVVIDVSFIALAKILPAVVKWLSPVNGHIIALIKPQFEAERGEIGEGGIVRDPAVHSRVIAAVESILPELGLRKRGLEPSPILGAEGNEEFLLWASR